MTAKTLQQFETMTDRQLSAVEGVGTGVCRPVYYAANGYSCRYSNGEWGYVVTKGAFQATTDVIANGWGSSLGGAHGYATSWGRRS
ncbi:ComC/BlpC family peptide pheromone/bacteriocin [Streptococcus chenjunshii]|uniref:ComC/BlpC family peptide pheromone/bacteriocin n=1 Tax=Streptococcus chenjunshii TaxID=2173853 RepID=A0A372KM60_9STRE|nr:garvicin Q family class II bacteriocin [Streptococcus chenjunshii]AXQ79140.1 ComC/BlpC family peptide pheromone/bacteriocin [Streptococcus chenjunshii]RFU50973.1 ComC/BlpC family peptide pheromone/bacteriocin [Streptococcus chenjunshii]RFU53365.1 ComC/BlpC family peptide pheromone/bacteriocin [Streptococcus chenjunshii]